MERLKLMEMRLEGQQIAVRPSWRSLRFVNIPPEYLDVKQQIFTEAEIIAKRQGWVLYAVCLERGKIILRFESGKVVYQVPCAVDDHRSAIIASSPTPVLAPVC